MLLLIDAAQGVQAQTLANLYLAMEHDLEIILVINKIDLPSADVDRVLEQIDSELGLDPASHLKCSAKDGTGIDEILEAIVERIPPPVGEADEPLAALIFDAFYDAYRGTVINCRIFHGEVKAGDTIRFMSNNSIYRVEEVEPLSPEPPEARQALRRRGGLHHRRGEDRVQREHRRHHHPGREAVRKAPSRLQKGQARCLRIHLSHLLGRL